MAQVEVKKEWLHACGFRQYDCDTAFPVIRSWEAGLFPFAELDMGDGRTLVVNVEWRGRYI